MLLFGCDKNLKGLNRTNADHPGPLLLTAFALSCASRIIWPGMDPPGGAFVHDAGLYHHGTRLKSLLGTPPLDEIAPETITPLFSLLSSCTFAWAGIGFQQVAFLSGLFGLLTVFSPLAAHPLGWPARILASVLVGIDLAGFQTARVGRPDSCMIFWASLIPLLFLRGIPEPLLWGMSGILLALSFHSLPHAFLLVPAIFLVVLFREKKPVTHLKASTVLLSSMTLVTLAFGPLSFSNEKFWPSLEYFSTYGDERQRYFQGPWLRFGEFLFHQDAFVLGYHNPASAVFASLAGTWMAGIWLVPRTKRGQPEGFRAVSILAAVSLIAISIMPVWSRRHALIAPFAALLTAAAFFDRSWQRRHAAAWRVRRRPWLAWLGLAVATAPLFSASKPFVAGRLALHGLGWSAAYSTAGYLLLGAAILLVAGIEVLARRSKRSASRVPRLALLLGMGSLFIRPLEHLLTPLCAEIPLGVHEGLSPELIRAFCAVLLFGFALGFRPLLSIRRVASWTIAIATISSFWLFASWLAPRRSDMDALASRFRDALSPQDIVMGYLSDTILFSVPCQTFTPWSWLDESEDDPSIPANRKWNENPVDRFRPTHLLLIDEGISPAYAAFHVRCSALPRELVREVSYYHHTIRLYRLGSLPPFKTR